MHIANRSIVLDKKDVFLNKNLLNCILSMIHMRKGEEYNYDFERIIQDISIFLDISDVVNDYFKEFELDPKIKSILSQFQAISNQLNQLAKDKENDNRTNQI